MAEPDEPGDVWKPATCAGPVSLTAAEHGVPAADKHGVPAADEHERVFGADSLYGSGAVCGAAAAAAAAGASKPAGIVLRADDVPARNARANGRATAGTWRPAA